MREYGCGLASFRPHWMQRFASPKWFMTVYGVLGAVQAMSYVYFISTLTTIEKRFGIQSKTTGFMLSGNEISQILFSLVLTYFGGQRNRPVWIAWGVTFSAVSCFVLAMPHFLYGAGTSALALTEEYKDIFGLNETQIEIKEKSELCSKEISPRDCTPKDYSVIPPLLVFMSQFILGIGTTLYFSLGQTYIDDNSKKTNTPMILGTTMALRTIGPSIGFVIGYLCLSLYIDPTLTPIIGKKDPRWLGAWWLGWIVLGCVMLILAVLLAMFPKKLRPTTNKTDKIYPMADQTSEHRQSDVNSNGKGLLIKDDKMPKLKDFPTALMRLLKNKLLVINIFSGVFYILGASGYITYMTKYMEIQFQRTSASANIVLGPVILLSMVFGFLISGFVISRYKPKPTYLLGWNVIVGICFVIGEFTYIFISCEAPNLVGYDMVTKNLQTINDCNVHCGCDNLKYSPVCLEEAKLTFYSPCHAGCRTVHVEDKISTYGNCSCTPFYNPVTIPALYNESKYEYETSGGSVMKGGTCETSCGYNYVIFVIISCIMQWLGSSGKIGNILVNYRAVAPEDKSFAQGLALLLISLMAFIPGPILFGYIIDSSCLIWEENCGVKGSCTFYDRDSFRHYMNGTAACLTIIGVVLDVIVCYLGKNLSLYEEENEYEDRNSICIKTTSVCADEKIR
nr:solute carrier organic anion transporter family member 2A1 [Halyomorpha halys]